MIDKDAMDRGGPKPDHAEALERFSAAMSADRTNREDAASDLRFIAGDQWPGEVRALREAQGRPVLTINRIPQFIRQVTGDMRQSRPSMKFAPVDNIADPKVAKLYTGISRHIERQSDADMAYTLAFQGAVGCGIGHWRISTEYVPMAVTEQDIFVRPIPNPLAVLWDPNAKEVTRKDAMFCFVIDTMTREAFETRWPDAVQASIESDRVDYSSLFWYSRDDVRIAEYWYRKRVKRELAQLGDGAVIDLSGVKPELRQFLDIKASRKVEVFEVEMCLISGSEVLEGPYRFASQYIPIVPVVGEETYVGDQVIRCGLIRHAKDSQRLYNIWRSAGAESIGLAPKAPWLVTPKMIVEHKSLWDRANTSPLPYLIYNPDASAPGGKPERIAQPQPPAAMWQEAQIAADDMKGTTGIYDAALGAKSNETSGRAILARQKEGDTSTYHFFDNLTHAIQHSGRIIAELIPKVYDTERVVRLLNEDGTEAWERINRPVQGGDGTTQMLNDLTVGKYDVVAVSGPSYTTQRIEAANAMLEFMRVFPAAAPVMADQVAKMMDWPGADEIAARLFAILPPQVQAAIQQAKQGEDGAPQPAPPQQPQPDAGAELQARKTVADIQSTEAKTQGQRIDNAMKAMSLGLSPMAPTDPSQQPAQG